MPRLEARLPFPAYRGDAPYVFVSYAHADARTVFPLIKWLHLTGVNIWYDEGISPGARWRDELAKAMEGASGFLFFRTASSSLSATCRSEVNFALEAGTPFLTVHLDDSPSPSGLRLAIADRQAVDLFGAQEQPGYTKVQTWLHDLLQPGDELGEVNAPFPPQVLETYQVHGALGASERAFRSYDTRGRRWVVLASIPDSEFDDWQTTLANLEKRQRILHVSLPVIYDVHLQGRSIVVVSEFVQGRPLDEILRNSPPALHADNWTLLRGVLRQVVQALQALHQRELSHGRVNVRNVRIKTGGRVVLVGGESVPGRSKAIEDILGVRAILKQGLEAVQEAGAVETTPPEDLVALMHALGDELTSMQRVSESSTSCVEGLKPPASTHLVW